MLANPAAAKPGAGPGRARDPQAHQGRHPEGTAAPFEEFQRIADRNGDNRASGLPGYDASADYVAKEMRKAGYQVTVQDFDFPFFEEFGSSFSQVAPTPTTYVDGETYDLMDFSGGGTAEAAVVPVDLALTPPRNSTSGCEAADFQNAAGAST